MEHCLEFLLGFEAFKVSVDLLSLLLCQEHASLGLNMINEALMMQEHAINASYKLGVHV